MKKNLNHIVMVFLLVAFMVPVACERNNVDQKQGVVSESETTLQEKTEQPKHNISPVWKVYCLQMV